MPKVEYEMISKNFFSHKKFRMLTHFYQEDGISYEGAWRAKYTIHSGTDYNELKI